MKDYQSSNPTYTVLTDGAKHSRVVASEDVEVPGFRSLWRPIFSSHFVVNWIQQWCETAILITGWIRVLITHSHCSFSTDWLSAAAIATHAPCNSALVQPHPQDTPGAWFTKYLTLTIMPALRSTYDGCIIYQTSYEERRTNSYIRSTCKIVR